MKPPIKPANRLRLEICERCSIQSGSAACAKVNRTHALRSRHLSMHPFHSWQSTFDHPWMHIPSRITQVVFKCPGSPVWFGKQPPNLYPAATTNSQSGRSTPAWTLKLWNQLPGTFNMTELLLKYNFINETPTKCRQRHFRDCGVNRY